MGTSPGAPNFLAGATLPLVGSSPSNTIQLGLLRGPHWYLPGPEQLARFCYIAIILLAIINSHGLHSLYLSLTLNWARGALKLEKLKKSEILGMTSWALCSHGLISP